jgi:hypothetical protein
MTISVEWRLNHDEDAILIIDEARGVVAEAMKPDATILKEFLAVSGTLDRWRQWTGWRAIDLTRSGPDAWGDVVLGRTADGAVTTIDPGLFWERVHRLFRSRGIDYNS